MSVKFQDYYETLGVERGASADDVQRAFRAKARSAHPAVDKEPGAEDRFKQLNEAYEVLKDPEKRQRYDQLGSGWNAGQDFTPPPAWENVQFDFGGNRDDLGGFSDFFSSLFGGGDPFGGSAGRVRSQRRGHDHEVEVEFDLEEIAQGGVKSVRLATRGDDGVAHTKTYEVKLPTGLADGSRIRLGGQGGVGAGGAPAGDLHLVVRARKHPRFSLHGHDLRTTCAITPWEAGLGGEVSVRTLTGSVTLKVAAGTQSGQVLRLRGQGLPRDDSSSGDLLVEMQIVVPAEPTAEERELFEQLAKVSSFEPDDRKEKP